MVDSGSGARLGLPLRCLEQGLDCNEGALHIRRRRRRRRPALGRICRLGRLRLPLPLLLLCLAGPSAHTWRRPGDCPVGRPVSSSVGVLLGRWRIGVGPVPAAVAHLHYKHTIEHVAWCIEAEHSVGDRRAHYVQLFFPVGHVDHPHPVL
jgi:hypothetical protein